MSKLVLTPVQAEELKRVSSRVENTKTPNEKEYDRVAEVLDNEVDWHHRFKPGEHLPWKGENFVVCELKGHLMMLMNVKAAGKLKVDTDEVGGFVKVATEEMKAGAAALKHSLSIDPGHNPKEEVKWKS